MNKFKSFIKAFTFALFGLFGLSIISCEEVTDNPSIESSDPTSEPVHTHKWDEGEVTKEATCIEEGQLTYSCTSCDEVKFETISALGHNEVIDEAKEATCTETGLTEGKHCDRCNEVLVQQEEISSLGHSFADWTIVKEATCENAGTKRRECNNCDHYEEETIIALGHNEVIDEEVKPTCVDKGLTQGSHCDRCEEVLVPQEEIPEMWHDYDDELAKYCNNCNNERKVDDILLSLSNNDVFGYAIGIDEKDYNDAIISLYNSTNSYISTLGENSEYYFNNIHNGDYFLKIEIAGYTVPSPIKVNVEKNKYVLQHLELSKITNSEYYYQWKADETYFGYEESASIPEKKTIKLFDEIVSVNDSSATVKLQMNHNIILSDEELSWSSDYAFRMLELIESIYEFPNESTSKWILTTNEIDDDIKITHNKDYDCVYISKSAFENAIPRKAEYNGLKGTFFSNRLYNALIRFATKSGTDIEYIDRILQNNYGCSIIVEDYIELTRGITNESSVAFEQFKPEELLSILEMFAEMPKGFHRIENLEYLVRRIDGSKNPIYPNAAAISWIYAEHGYIEFIDSAFLGSEVEDTFRLILHEKSHFLWTHVFSEELKEKWIEIGGWYETSNDEDGWTTSKEVEFVTAYAHAHNPDEDMAESIAYYILLPDRLESRSKSKYEFIRDYIMNGDIYITQIREDLTFEVYNLYPDYSYPGRIIGVEIEVNGKPEEDKEVTVTIELDTHGDPSYGATGGITRVFFDNGAFYDMYFGPVDDKNSILRGGITMSKYSAKGYWHCEQITLFDQVGNQRFVGVDNFGWKLYIDNPLQDLTPPEYIKDSINTEMEKIIIDGRELTNIYIKFKAYDAIGVKSVYCEIANNTTNSYRMDAWGSFNNETGEGVITYTFTEYTHSGEYSVNYLMLEDYAGNQIGYNFYFDGTGAGYPTTFYYFSKNSDYEAPELDVNNIKISASPTHPDNPNGETVVKIEYYAKDNTSGLGLVSFQLLNPVGNTFMEYHYHENFYTMFFEGDPTIWKKYEINIILPEGSVPGKWGLLEFYLCDKAGNSIHYNFLEILHFQVSN